MPEPARAEHDKRKKQAADRQQAEERGRKGLEMGDKHARQLSWVPTIARIASRKDKARGS